MSRYPDDMDDDAILIPVDVSGEEETFPTTYEELVEKAIFFFARMIFKWFMNKHEENQLAEIPPIKPPPGVKKCDQITLHSYQMNKLEIVWVHPKFLVHSG